VLKIRFILGMILISIKRAMAGLLVLIAACNAPAPEDGRPSIVVTTGLLGDIVKNITGDLARVSVLLPAGADPHEFQISAAQLVSLVEADLVVANGLGLEQGLDDALAEAAASGVQVVQLAASLDPLPFPGGGLDPHFWLDPVRTAQGVEIIAERLEQIRPDPQIVKLAASYAEEILATHREIEVLLGGLPSEQRRLVTNHESLAYFADRYGFDVIGVLIPGGSTQAAPSAANLAELVATMRSAGVDNIFADTSSSPAVAEALASEVPGAEVIELYTESLGPPGSGAETYLDLLIKNTELIAGALA
jgi:zinc/manganese transport system substrate-binding protein